MPFKSKKQKRLFGACRDPEFRAKRRRQGMPCPDEKTIRKFFNEDKKKGGMKRKKRK